MLIIIEKSYKINLRSNLFDRISYGAGKIQWKKHMITQARNEYMNILSDPSFRLTAEKLVLKCGIRADLKGYRCLADAVILYGTDTCTGFCEIYRAVGTVRDLKAKSVMREISYAISQSFDIASRLSEMMGIDIPESDIHSALVIAYLGQLFKNPSLSLYA